MSRKTEKNGALPEGWRRVRLGEIYNISASGDFDAKESSRTQNEKHPYPVYSNALTNKGLHSYSTYSRYDEDSITITARGDIGFANHRKTKFMAIGRLLVLKNKIPVSNEFVCEYINHSIRFFKETTGVAQLTVPQASKYYITLPPFPDQKAIASLLEKWDAAIEKTEALIAAKEKQFKWLLKRLISDQQDNPEWRKVRLRDTCEIITSPVDKKIVDGELSVKLCNYTDVYYNNTIDSNINFMTATAKPREIERFSLVKGDVIITKDSETPDDIGVPAYVKETIRNLLCGYHLAILRPKKYMTGKYICYALTSPRIKNDFYRFANGITRFGLTSESYQKIKISLPSLPEQKRIANVLETTKKEMELLEKLVEQYRNQKHGLMQKLLVGKWRIQIEINKQ